MTRHFSTSFRYWTLLGVVSLALILSALTACQPGKTPAPAQVEAVQSTSAVVANSPTSAPQPTAAATAAPESSPTPAPAFLIRLDQPGMQFTLKEKKELPPAEILREVSYSGGFGGGGGYACFVLDQQPATPTILDEGVKDHLEWGESISFMVCGWQPGENVTYRVISPEGKTISEEQTQVDQTTGYPRIHFEAALNTPPGEYRLTFTGQKDTLEKKLTISLPDGPRMYLNGQQLILYNFQPEEAVRLYVYWKPLDDQSGMYQASLYGWEDFRTDSSGRLVTQVDKAAMTEMNDGVWYVAIGQATGEVHVFPEDRGSLKQNIFSRLGFQITLPDDSGTVKAKNIWDLVKYKDMYAPGQKEYTLSIQSTDTIRWRFAWCAVNPDTLDQNLKEISVEFWADGEAVDPGQVAQTSLKSDNSWQCKRWTSFLSNWKPGAKHTLEMRYTLQSAISDGASNYQAGEYRQIVHFEVKP